MEFAYYNFMISLGYARYLLSYKNERSLSPTLVGPTFKFKFTPIFRKINF